MIMATVCPVQEEEQTKNHTYENTQKALHYSIWNSTPWISCIIKERDDNISYSVIQQNIPFLILLHCFITEEKKKWSNTCLAIYQSDQKKYLEQSLCDPWVIFHILQSQNPTLLVWRLHSLTPSHWKLGEI